MNSAVSLLKGDCKDYHSVISEYDALITDPPYNISKPNNFKSMKNNMGGTFGMEFGDWDHDFDIVGWIPGALEKLKKGGNIVIFNDWRNLGDISKKLESCGCIVKRCLIWKKTNPTPFNRNRLFVNSAEYAVWAVKPGKKWTFNRQKDNFETGIFEYPSNSKNIHPTQKSLALAENIIEILTNKGGLIYDPFAGSGTFGVAAINKDRRYFGVEIDEGYFNIAHKRIKDHLRIEFV